MVAFLHELTSIPPFAIVKDNEIISLFFVVVVVAEKGLV
jgi:hypothetical protein